MKSLLTITLLLFVQLTFGQISTIDVVGGAHSSYRILSNSENPEVQQLINVRNNLETRRINYILGFNINYKLNERVFIKSGIRYTEKGYSSTYHFPNSIFCGVGDPINHNFQFKNTYLEVPFAVRVYQKNDSEFKSYVELGLAPSKLLTTNLFQPENFNTFHLPATLAIGAEYEFVNHLAFVQLVNKADLMPNGVEMKERFVELGFEAGVRFNINKFGALRKQCKTKLKKSIHDIKAINS